MKLLMYNIMVMSVLMAISSSNTIMMWLSMELNLFSFIPILMNKMTSNETEASMNYFLSQALGSMLFLSSSMMLLSSQSMMMPTFIMMISILLKSGAAPCFFWFPATMEQASWMNCFILSTWQKIAPLFILLYIIFPMMKAPFIIPTVVSMNAIIGGMMGLTQSSMKKIMAYSSITHISWMLSSSIINAPCLFITYLLMYSTMILPLFMSFSKTKTNKIYDLWSNKSSSQIIIMSTMLLSLGGMPPLSGFIPKFLMVQALLNNSVIVTIMLIFGSIMNLFFYTNIILNTLMSTQLVKQKMKVSSLNILLATNFLMMLIMLT